MLSKSPPPTASLLVWPLVSDWLKGYASVRDWRTFVPYVFPAPIGSFSRFWAEWFGTVSTLLFTERVVVELSNLWGCLQSSLFSSSDQLGPCSTLSRSLARLPRGTAHSFRAAAQADAHRVPPPALAGLYPPRGCAWYGPRLLLLLL